MDLVVAFTVSGQRPHYLRRTLSSWQAARGCESAKMVFVCEPGTDTRELPGEVITCPERPAGTPLPLMVASLPTQTALAAGFERSGFVIQAEEDFIVSTDILEYFTWAAERFRYDKDTAAVCSTQSFPAGGDPAAVVRLPGQFRPGVWGTWSGRALGCWSLEPLEDYWQPWDFQLQRQFRISGKAAVFPMVARSQHIGVVSTIRAPELSELVHRSAVAPSFRPDVAPTAYEVTARGVMCGRP